MNSSEITKLKTHCERLGLSDKSGLDQLDVERLTKELLASNEFGLAAYVKSLKEPAELEDLIVNTIYG